MSTTTTALKFLLIADDHASTGIKGVGTSADGTGSKLSKLKTVGTAAFLGVGAAAGEFAKSSVEKFSEVTHQSWQLQRAMGGSLAEASRWREAAQLAGVDSGAFTKSVGRLDKTLVTATQSTAANARMTSELGFKFQDAHGKVLPMSTLMPKIADKFKSMPDGVQKTALAMTLFGRSGTQLLPMLDRGSAGLADLRKKSDELGTTIGNDAVDKLEKNKDATREWDGALDGLKIQVGSQLMPILTGLITFISAHVIPIFEAVTKFVMQHKNAVMFAAIAVGTLLVGIKAWTIAQAALNFVMDANPVMLVVVAIAALAAGLVFAWNKSKTFRDVVKGVFSDVTGFVKTVGGWFVWLWNHSVGWLIGKWQTGFATVRSFVSSVFGAVGGFIRTLGAAFAWLWNHSIGWMIGKARAGFDVMRNFVHSAAVAIGSRLRELGGWFAWLWNHSVGWAVGKIHDGIGGVASFIKGAFAGIGGAIRTIGGWFVWLWNHSIGWVIAKITAGIHKIQDLSNSVAGALTGGNITTGGPQIIDQGAGHATGGSVSDGFFTVGEHGPETGYKSGNNVVVWPHGRKAGGAGGTAGREVHLHVHVSGVIGNQDAVHRAVLAGLQRLKGQGMQLGLT